MPNEAITRVDFWEVFSALPDETLSLRQDLIVNGVRFAAGTQVGPNQLLSGVDINKRRGIPLAVVTLSDGAYVLRGFYLPNA